MIRLVLILLLVAGCCSAANPPLTTTRPMLFVTGDRLTDMQAKESASSSDYAYMKSRVDTYLSTLPANKGEYAAATALIYKLTGTTAYLDRAKELFRGVYIDSDSGYYWDYQSRNGFRSEAKWAAFIYDWIYNDLSASEKTEFQSVFKAWGEYWVNYVDYANDFASFNSGDSDETTSLAENLLLLAICLYNDDAYSSTLFDVADAMLTNFVVGEYMSGVMAGGVWAEGSDYSPATMQHWVRAYIVNKEVRGISYPNTYIDDALRATLHQTFPGFTGMFAYGDIESATDYSPPPDEYRYDLMLHLSGAAETASVQAAGISWLKTISNNSDIPDGSTYTGIYRVLFEPQSMSITTNTLDKMHYAAGTGFISMRTSWDDSANVLYFLNSKINVDHQHQDALSFSFVRGGEIVTKEASGYGGISVSSLAHNALLIENDDSGSSNPTYRPVGEGSVETVYSSDSFGYIDAIATNIYNMTGANAENYADLVERKIAFIKPSTLVVCDTIKIAAAYSPRWKKYIQHFQAEPTLSDGVYSADSDGNRLFFKPLHPDSTKTIVDESVLWVGTSTSTMPANQMKYHVSIAPDVDTDSQIFVNVLHVNDDTVSTMPDASASVDDSVVVVVGDVATIVSKDDSSISSLVYTADATAHYIADLPVNTQITVQRNGSDITGSPFDSGDAGIISFAATSGSASYSIAAGGATPSASKHLRLSGNGPIKWVTTE